MHLSTGAFQLAQCDMIQNKGHNVMNQNGWQMLKTGHGLFKNAIEWYQKL